MVMRSAFCVQHKVCSSQHAAADPGAGAWIGEGTVEPMIVAAVAADPAHPPVFMTSSSTSRSAFKVLTILLTLPRFDRGGLCCTIREGDNYLY